MRALRTIGLNIKPLGDAVMMRALVYALALEEINAVVRMPKFMLDLATMLNMEAADLAEPFEHETFEMGPYLENDVHWAELPDERFRSEFDIPRQTENGKRLAHLCQWMAVHLAPQLRVNPFSVNPAEITIALSENLLHEGRRLLRNQLPGERMMVLISANAGSQNRYLPPDVINATVALLKEDFDIALLTPEPTILGYADIKIPRVSCQLHELPAMLAGAAAVVSTDSGPYHVAAAAIQGSNLNPKRLILVAGSSNPMSLLYQDNQYVEAPSAACAVSPCGRHGYGSAVPERLKGYELHVLQQSSCVFPSYPATSLAPCMEAISAKDIAEKVRQATAW